MKKQSNKVNDISEKLSSTIEKVSAYEIQHELDNAFKLKVDESFTEMIETYKKLSKKEKEIIIKQLLK